MSRDLAPTSYAGLRSGFLDPANERTNTNVVDLYVTEHAIVADCRACGASSHWLMEEAEQAARAIRLHNGPEFCR